MNVIAELETRRRNTWHQLKDLLDTATRERRELRPDEQRRIDSLNRDLDGLDSRLAQLRGIEAGQQDAENVLGGILSQPVTLRGYVGGLSTRDADTADAFRSAIVSRNPAPIEVYSETPRFISNPGVERRDTLKTTATQALRTSVYDRIVMHLVDSSAVIAAGATVLNTATGEDLVVPKDTAFSTSALTAESASITESDPTLAVSTLKAYKYATFFQVSRELADDSPTNLLNYLTQQAAQSLALAFGPYLITGTGTAQPQGIVTAASTSVGPTGTATSLGTQATAGQGTDALYTLIGSLPEPYARSQSTSFILNNASLATARKLKDNTGQPVTGMTNGAPSANQILGYPAYVDANVANMAANAKSIIFGDMSRYFVRIVNGIRFERSDEFAFQNDLISFRAIIRLDGALVDASGIKVFQNSAT